MIYTNFEDMANCIRKNLWKIPADVDLIVGVPRSGMMPALMISEFLNKRVTDIDTFAEQRPIHIGRRGNYRRSGAENKVLVVDDTVYTGWAIENAKEQLKHLEDKYDIQYCCVYAEGKDAKEKVDIWLEDNSLLNGGKKYLYEWNIFQHVANKGKWMMWDMDGLICKDPPNDENRAAYEAYLPNAVPMIIPSNHIGGICTYRLDKYRDVTKAWLQAHGVDYDELHMFPARTREERNASKSPARYKAEIYRASKWAQLFLESEVGQAERIHKMSGKPVFCYENGRMYE